jgi:hypothetical protein
VLLKLRTLGLPVIIGENDLMRMENTMLLLAALAIIVGTMWSVYILWSAGMG